MGFMKDIRELKNLSAEATKDFDPAAQMRAATAQMQQATAQSRLASSANAVSAPATVVAIRDTGRMVNYQPMVEVDVLVTPEGAVPWPATVSTIGHGQLAGLQVGVRVGVRYDPADTATVAFA
jgi:hypothetical protein